MRFVRRFFKSRMGGQQTDFWESLRRPAQPLHFVRRKFLLHGQSYNVILHKEAATNRLVVQGSSFVVSLSPCTHENFERFMEAWYRRQARQTFQSAIDHWIREFHARGIHLPAPRMKIYAMRRAWGRCYYTKGLITMNLHLVKTPLPCIRYIVLHELCHFLVNNHSKDFHALVESFLPDWREVDMRLKSFTREQRILE